MPSTRRAKRAAAAVYSNRALADKNLVRLLAEYAGPGRDHPVHATDDLEDALRETEAPHATPLVFAVAVAPLRLVSKDWAQALAPGAIHGRAFAPARRLAARIELPTGLAAIVASDVLAVGGTEEQCWDYILTEANPWEDEGFYVTSSVLAWEPRPAHEELFARAQAGMAFQSAASTWGGSCECCSGPLISGLRGSFADALVQREWLVNVSKVVLGDRHHGQGSSLAAVWDRHASLIQFARELLPPGSIMDEPPLAAQGGAPPTSAVPGNFSIHALRASAMQNNILTKSCVNDAFRVIPLAFTTGDLRMEEAYASDYDERESVCFPGGFVLTAAGECVPSASRGWEGGPVGAAVALEAVAANEQAALDELDVAEWDASRSIEALAASRAAYTAMAATLRRSSQTPALYALCSMRALVVARRAEPRGMSGVGLLCRADLPLDVFRLSASFIGDSGAGAGHQESLIRLDSVDIEFRRVPRSTTHPKEGNLEDYYGSESIVPRVEMIFRTGYGDTRQLRISGWLSGFTAYHDYDYDFRDDRSPDKKARVLRAGGALDDKFRASAMPPQVDRQYLDRHW